MVGKGDSGGVAVADDVRSVLDSIRRIVRELRLSDRAAEKRLGLSAAQLFVLHKLAAGPALSLNELADRTLTHQSSVSVVVQRLVERKLAVRVRSDRDLRRVELSLTPAGRRVVGRAPEAAQVRLIEGLGRMRSAERRKLASLLGRLVNETGIDDKAPTMFFEDADQSPPRASRRRNGRNSRRQMT